MNEKAKREMPGHKPPRVGVGRAMSAQSHTARAAMAAGRAQEIILPEIICFWKAAL
jgi:hypothetical protein